MRNRWAQGCGRARKENSEYDKRMIGLRSIFVFTAAVAAVRATDIAPADFKARRAELIRRFPDVSVLWLGDPT